MFYGNNTKTGPGGPAAMNRGNLYNVALDDAMRAYTAADHTAVRTGPQTASDFQVASGAIVASPGQASFTDGSKGPHPWNTAYGDYGSRRYLVNVAVAAVMMGPIMLGGPAAIMTAVIPPGAPGLKGAKVLGFSEDGTPLRSNTPLFRGGRVDANGKILPGRHDLKTAGEGHTSFTIARKTAEAWASGSPNRVVIETTLGDALKQGATLAPHNPQFNTNAILEYEVRLWLPGPIAPRAP
jgi:hypothetical protein